MCEDRKFMEYLCPKSKIIFLNKVNSERKKKVKHKLCNMLTLGNTGF